MQTHDDLEHTGRTREWWDRLQDRARAGQRESLAEITAGKPGEKDVDKWRARCGMNVIQRPDDEQGILRISVGGQPAILDYCVFRGDREKCAALLERALAALRARYDVVATKPCDDEPDGGKDGG